PTEKSEAEKEEGEDEKEDPIRKLYINLRKPGFKEFVSSHLQAIPGMEEKYQAEIRSKWQGFYPDEPYPLDAPKEEAPVEETEKAEETDKPDPPTTLNCPLSYNDRPEKNDEGRVSVDVCDNTCTARENCVAYNKYSGNINS
ncbi:unnamed protein product, partial [marine sediment metagenome]